MFDRDDVVRSVRRYAAGALGEPWTIRLQASAIADEQRPLAVLEAGPLTAGRSRATVPQGDTEAEMSLTLTTYPVVDLQGDPRAARLAADRLAQLLHDLVEHGYDVPRANGRPGAGPLRLPLWDYTAAATSGVSRAGAPFPHDVLWVEDHSSRPIQDPIDPQRWTVVLDMRLSWRRPGRVGPPAPVVTGVPGTYIPPE